MLYAEDTQSKPYNVKFLTVSRYVVLMFLSSIFTLSWIVYSYFLAIQAYSHLSPDLIFTYLPGTLVSGFVMTVILCAITMFVVTVMGEWRLGAVGGFAFYYILGSSLGFSPHLFTWDSLAIFSPYHLYRFLAFAFSGHIDDPVMGIIWGDPGRMNMILGFNFGFPDILLSLALWTVFGFILLILVQYPLREDADFSMLEAKLNQFEKDDVHLLSKLEGIKTNLKRRRLALGMVLVLLLILLPIARTSTMFTFEEENTEILYQTPSGGVSLALGEWRYGEVDITSPPSGLNNMYQIHVVILAWGESPEELELWRILNPISISSFEAMNSAETEPTSTLGVVMFLYADSKTFSNDVPCSFSILALKAGTLLGSLVLPCLLQVEVEKYLPLSILRPLSNNGHIALQDESSSIYA